LGLGQVISMSHDVEVVLLELAATISDFDVAGSSPDVVILDTTRGSVSRIQRLRSAVRMIPFVIWERAGAIEPSLNALAMGAQGVLLDNSSPADVMACLDKVLRGGSWVPPEIAQATVLTRQCKLTRREAELVQLIGFGLSNKQIAFSLGIAVGTVKVYLCKLFDKLGVSDRFELALLALRQAGSGGAVPDPQGLKRHSIASGSQEQYWQRSVFVPRRGGEWGETAPHR